MPKRKLTPLCAQGTDNVLIRAGLHPHTAHASMLYRAAPCTTSSDYYVVTINERLDHDEKDRTNIPTLGGKQEMVNILRPGLTKLLQTSRKPIAQRFDRWIRH